MPFTLKTQHEGQEITLEVGDEAMQTILETGGYQFLRKGQLPPGAVAQETLNATIADRLARHTATLKGDVVKAREVLEAHGIPFSETGEIAFPTANDFDETAERERLKRLIHKEEVEPLRSQITASDARTEKLLAKLKREAIMQQARAAGVEEVYLESPVEGVNPPILALVADAVAFDEGAMSFSVRAGQNDDGTPKFAPSTKEGKAWKDLSDLFTDMRSDKRYGGIFKTKQPGQYSPGDTNGRHQTKTKNAFKTDDERIAFVSEHGLDAYLDLPDG